MMLDFPSGSKVTPSWPDWGPALAWVQAHFNPYDVREESLPNLSATDVQVGLFPAVSERYWLLFWESPVEGPVVVWYAYDDFPTPKHARRLKLQWSSAMWENGPSLLDVQACKGRRDERVALVTDAYYIGGESTHQGSRSNVRRLLDVRRCYRSRDDWALQVQWLPWTTYQRIENLASDLYRAGGLLFTSKTGYGPRAVVWQQDDVEDVKEAPLPPGAVVVEFSPWEIPDVYPLPTTVDVHQKWLYLPSKEASRDMVAWTEQAYPEKARVVCQKDYRKRWYPVRLK